MLRKKFAEANFYNKNRKRDRNISPVRLRKGLGKVVSAQAREFAPKRNQGRNLIKMRKIRTRRIFSFNLRPAGATSFVRSATSFAAGNIVCAKHNNICRRQLNSPEALSDAQCARRRGRIPKGSRPQASARGGWRICRIGF